MRCRYRPIVAPSNEQFHLHWNWSCKRNCYWNLIWSSFQQHMPVIAEFQSLAMEPQWPNYNLLWNLGQHHVDTLWLLKASPGTSLKLVSSGNPNQSECNSNQQRTHQHDWTCVVLCIWFYWVQAPCKISTGHPNWFSPAPRFLNEESSFKIHIISVQSQPQDEQIRTIRCLKSSVITSTWINLT